MPKKKFIDKKHATTFVLANRSQRDPLLADEDAPKNILLPLDQVPSLGGPNPGGTSSGKPKDEKDTFATRKEEQMKYGIYFDDKYDYLQHLRDSREVSNIEWDYCERIYAPAPLPRSSENGATSSIVLTKDDLKDVKLKLPSSLFESEYKEDIGLLNKAATSRGPRPDLDPDIIAALDDDFDFENKEYELEDNFVELANLEQGVIEGEPTAEDLEGLFSSDDEDGNNSEHDDYEDEMGDSLGSLKGPHQYMSDDDDENKSRFTNYSMSSSVVRRNKQLLLVDDCFEKMFEGYDDTEIGALDCDEIEGHINADSDLLLKYANEFEQDRKKEELINEKISNLALREESDSNDDEMSDSDEDKVNRDKWDCESILSTYSNTKNRPKLISEPSKKNHIRISGKTGIPVDVLGKGLTKHALKTLDDQYAVEHNVPTKSIMSGVTSIRSKTETSDERRDRKKLVKEYRRERRMERKANTEAFKDEKKRLEKVRINDKHNIPTLKL
ncbi:protein LTV1 homolog [Folsomia candida]|uniref:Protein LTV1 homolog n=1 Tax=Folsomia candida TaxID=158441 RepID=A0A226F1P4_FOLCA|nr:protein LTV1 homolog [Folsomia candida]OXA63705.1 Protein LTV1 [Folsomia candida]